jgi:glycosyltransferase involved in cell wall biosynthesis
VAVLLVGAGLFAADSARFREQIEAAGLRDAIIETGWVELDELPATLAAADVGLYLMDDTLLNRTKCPVKLADMLVAGVPVVAEAVGQVTEYVRDSRSGTLCETGDVAGLVAAAVALLANAGEQGSRGVGVRADVLAQFSWERLVETVEKAYRFRSPFNASSLLPGGERRSIS